MIGPKTPAARLEWIATLLEGLPVVDDDGKDTGERSGPLITPEQARALLEDM